MTDDVKEKCGIFGIWSPTLDVARTTFYGLFALQHRGQEGSGICTADAGALHFHRGVGLVSQIYTDEAMRTLRGHSAIGHNRYSTSHATGAAALDHVQPFFFEGQRCSLAHNGNLPSVIALQLFLKSRGIQIETANDSQLMHLAIETYLGDGCTLPQAVKAAYPLFTGAFSLLVMDKEYVVAVRDQYGMRPFAVGVIGTDTYVFASETCALETVGADVYWDVGPGEMLVVNEKRIYSEQLAEPTPKFDVFEYVYFARPDSLLLGKSVYQVRWNFGKELAKEAPLAVDMVIPVPETAIPSAIGFAKINGAPLEMALTKNRYIHRTFISPDHRARERGVQLKLTPLRGLISGKRIAVMDDSIVRGTTSRELVKLLFSAGAKEVHFLVASPPVRFPDFYGIDTPKQDDLIAANMSTEQIKTYLGATSLRYLSTDAMVRAIGVPRDQLSLSCFTGEYPIPLLERAVEVRY